MGIYKFASYKMTKNNYLGDCFAVVVYYIDKPRGVTRNELTVLIKTKSEIWRNVNVIEDLRKEYLFPGETPFLRLGSECFLGIMGDSHCNCEAERIEALKTIGDSVGIYIHLPQEAQGQGLFYKAQELNLQVNGRLPDGRYIGGKTQQEAAKILMGTPNMDIRSYDCINPIVDKLDLRKYQFKLMSRNPNKAKALKEIGINVVAMHDIFTPINPHNLGEVLTKWIDKKFCITYDEIVQVNQIIEEAEELPIRAADLLMKAEKIMLSKDGEDLQNKMYVNKPEKDRFLINIKKFNAKRMLHQENLMD